MSEMSGGLDDLLPARLRVRLEEMTLRAERAEAKITNLEAAIEAYVVQYEGRFPKVDRMFLEALEICDVVPAQFDGDGCE